MYHKGPFLVPLIASPGLDVIVADGDVARLAYGTGDGGVAGGATDSPYPEVTDVKLYVLVRKPVRPTVGASRDAHRRAHADVYIAQNGHVRAPICRCHSHRMD